MSDAIIAVENLGKRYRIAHQRQGGQTLREALTNAARGLVRGLVPSGKRSGEDAAAQKSEEFWALRNVSFEVKQGEVVGFIGRNGAGKSTLLKLLSRITEPTEGRIHLRGRVASLLEVGTGFHPELTGRENIFLNGAILGMRREEIKRKFDEIVDFAGTEKFLDTPVKHYSSGMYVRLAFAVAAHLEPEILIVDEVLAVGDSEFQKKCLGKMRDVSHKEGRTVLFVSHNMPAVEQLCSRGAWLQAGTLTKVGKPGELIRDYLKGNTATVAYWAREEPFEEGAAVITQVAIVNADGELVSQIRADEAFGIKINVVINEPSNQLQIAVRLTNENGVPVVSTCNTDYDREYIPFETGRYEMTSHIPASFLAPGDYTVIAAIHTPKIGLIDVVDSKVKFGVDDVGSLSSFFGDGRLGAVEPIFKWSQSS